MDQARLDNASRNKRYSFYGTTISQVIPQKDASVLITGGGPNDAAVFSLQGYTDVTLCNLDVRIQADDLKPYKYRREDSENLKFKDDSFDYVVTHMALHHCYSPHRALLEMYRVARKGVLFIENRDSFMMRFAEWMKLAQVYELTAVLNNASKFGGVQNLPLPNYVYRWNEREVSKVIRTIAPHVEPRIKYMYGLDISNSYSKAKGLRRLFLWTAGSIVKLLTSVFVRQRNLMAVYIEKPQLPEDLQPWLEMKEGEVILRGSKG